MKLPAALTPWAEHLRIFPDEISLILGEYARRISPLVGPLDAAAADPDGEPNGYDGVARRGIYERLLISELALAAEHGAEFIRRAAMGEHLFLNLARVAPGAKRVSIALFDAGPLQLGTPRLAHLAAFIVLARRAGAARAEFLWGVLQDARQLVLSDDTEASIGILLESRTAREAAAEDAAAWREKLAALDRPADVWLVGGAAAARFEAFKGFSRLTVEESLELDRRELELTVKSASGPERRTVLALPPPPTCTRLLRNPFERLPPVAGSARLDGRVTNFFFDPTGSKLFARLDSHRLLAFPVQNVRGAEKMRPAIYSASDPLTSEPTDYIAAGRLHKALVVGMKVDDRTLRLVYRKSDFGLEPGLYRTSGEKFAFPGDGGLLPIFNTRPNSRHYAEAAILDAAGTLFLFNRIGQESDGGEPVVGTLMPLATDVLAVTQSDRKFLYVGCEDGRDYHRLVLTSDVVERRPLAAKRLKQAFFGRAKMGARTIAFEDEDGRWTISDEDNNLRQMPHPRGEVVGVTDDPRFTPVPGFFVLADDRRTLTFGWQHGRRRTILKSADELVRIEFSPRSPVLAYQTAAGELVLFSLTHQAVIGRYSK